MLTSLLSWIALYISDGEDPVRLPSSYKANKTKAIEKITT